MLSAQAKEDVSVLYVGGSPDINTIGGVSIDSAVIAKSVKERTADFTKFLKQRFNKVRAVDGKDYTSGMSDGYDVTVFDGRPKAIRPAVRETDDKGRIIKYIRPAYLPDDFDRAAVCIAEMSEDLGRSVGTKNDWFCLCLYNYAHNWKKGSRHIQRSLQSQHQIRDAANSRKCKRILSYLRLHSFLN